MKLTPCQKSKEVSSSPITYFIAPGKTHCPEAGEYKTYGIAAFRHLGNLPILVVRDVSTNGDLVFHMTRAFNRHKLSPIHLMDAIEDMLG